MRLSNRARVIRQINKMTKLLTGLLLFACISWTSCNSTSLKKTNIKKDSTKIGNIMEESSVLIDRETALKIAEKNALTTYRDLSIYDVKAELRKEKWYVDYELSNLQMVGGGPHYVISATTGEILSCRYEQ